MTCRYNDIFDLEFKNMMFEEVRNYHFHHLKIFINDNQRFVINFIYSERND